MKRIRKDSLNARSWDHPSNPLVKAVNGRLLRPCLGQGASLGEEAVLADSGRVGEIPARVGRVRNLAFLSILRGVPLLSQTCGLVKFQRAHRVFPQAANVADRRENLVKKMRSEQGCR